MSHSNVLTYIIMTHECIGCGMVHGLVNQADSVNTATHCF